MKILFESDMERTILAIHGELFTDFAEIRTSDEADGHPLPELAEKFDHLRSDFLSERWCWTRLFQTIARVVIPGTCEGVIDVKENQLVDGTICKIGSDHGGCDASRLDVAVQSFLTLIMAHRYYVFSLPSQLVDTLTPRALFGQEPPREPSPPLPKVAPVSNAKGCNICLGAAFTDVDEQRAHFRTDWHRYNVKIRLAGGSPVTESAFVELVGGTHLLSSPHLELTLHQAWMILFRVPLPPTTRPRTNRTLSMRS